MIRIICATLLTIVSLQFGLSQIAQNDFTISRPAGFFEEPFDLRVIPISDSARVVYTDDLSEPLRSSTEFPDKLMIEESKIIKIKVYNGNDSTQTISYTYFNISQIRQEQDLTSVSESELKAAFEALPVIAVSGTQIDPVDKERIEVPVAAEFIWNNPSMQNIIINAGLQIWGDSPTNPKKNFRLEFKKKYGDKKLNGNIFHENNSSYGHTYIPSVDSYDKLLLRAGSQDGLNAEFSNELTPQYIRNRVMYDLSLEAGMLAPHGRFVHLFLNGQYWGHYHLMERPDESFFEDYLTVDKDDIEIVKAGEVWHKGNQSDTVWYQLDSIDFSTSSMDKLAGYIDPQMAARYLVFMGYASGYDWGKYKNMVGYYGSLGETNGYRFMLYDVDYSLGNGGKWHPEKSSDPEYFFAPFDNSGPVPAELLQNENFLILLRDELYNLCIKSDGILTPDHVEEMYSRRAAEVEVSLLAEQARWGSNPYQSYGWHIAVDSWEVNEEWEDEKKRILNTYIPKRTKALIQHFEEKGYSSPLASVKFKTNQRRKTLSLKNPNKSGEIYYTLDGSDPRLSDNSLSPEAVRYDGPIPLATGTNTVFARVISISDDKTMCSASSLETIWIK
jgi:hypothetical protein